MRTRVGFAADIGNYDAGKHIALPNARTLPEAILQANASLGTEELTGKAADDPHVVQIFYNGMIVWDYMNGSFPSIIKAIGCPDGGVELTSFA